MSEELKEARKQEESGSRFAVHFPALLALLLAAGTFQFLSWKGIHPFPFLTSDAANIAAMVAAGDHSEALAKDSVFGNPDNYRFYTSVLLPYLRWMTGLTGDHGVGFMLLVGPMTFLQGLGFYVLGLQVYRSRFWALILAFSTFPRIHFLPFLEFWGVFENPLPRVLFQSLLPFLLTAALRWRERPDRWLWLMLATGALVYVHPVSAPAWAAAIWLGLWSHQPSDWKLGRRVGVMSGLGLLFVLAALPFALRFPGGGDPSGVVSYEQVHTISRERFAWGYFQLPAGLLAVAKALTECLVLPAGLVGVVLALRRWKQEPQGVTLLIWLIGILLVCGVIPVVEQGIAGSLKRMPPELDLVRNVRYLVPLLWLFALWTPARMAVGATTPVRGALALVAVVGLTVWTLRFPPVPTRDVKTVVKSILRGSSLIRSDEEALREALTVLRDQTPKGSVVLPAGAHLAVRYFSQRPVAFAYKDGGLLAYANRPQLLKWNAQWQRVRPAHEERDRARRLKLWLEVARELRADYLLLDLDVRPYPFLQTGELTYANSHWSIVRMPH